MEPHFLVVLCLAFFAIALVYASVGFGGGSSYTALLALTGMTTAWIPVLSLSCNLIVSGGGAWQFTRRGHLRWKLALPLIATSMPAAYLAGRVRLDDDTYLLLLAVSLLLAAIMMLLRRADVDQDTRECALPAALAIGAGMGALSGLVGIGGGIFLAPVLIIARWATPKQSAAMASVFIFLNSAAGLAGQVSKPEAAGGLAYVSFFALAVLAGGQIGSRWGAGILTQDKLRQITASLILLMSLRIFTGIYFS